jgi:endogenous inhibitor of DNA gyrase (YacG/DUF329 family)
LSVYERCAQWDLLRNVRKLYAFIKTLQRIPFSHLSSHKYHYVSKLSLSFSITRNLYEELLIHYNQKKKVQFSTLDDYECFCSLRYATVDLGRYVEKTRYHIPKDSSIWYLSSTSLFEVFLRMCQQDVTEKEDDWSEGTWLFLYAGNVNYMKKNTAIIPVLQILVRL